MSVHRIACAECRYVLIYATFGPNGSYRTGSTFESLCSRKGEIRADDAMSCPALRPAIEKALREQLPGWKPPD